MQGKMLGHAAVGEQMPLKRDRPSDQEFEIGRVTRRQEAGTVEMRVSGKLWLTRSLCVPIAESVTASLGQAQCCGHGDEFSTSEQCNAL